MLTREQVEPRLKTLIADQLCIGQDEVFNDTSFVELGADSLDIVEMIINTEDEFGIEILDKDAEKMYCLQDVSDYLTTNPYAANAK